MRNSFSRRHITVVVRPVDDACNLSCSYCDAAAYDSNSVLMGEDTLRRLMEQSSRLHGYFINFCWHGGEPLLAGKEFYRQVFELQKLHFSGIFRRGRCDNVIQTNGLLLDKEYVDLFAEEQVSIGFSLDGPDGECNIYRFSPEKAKDLIQQTIGAFELVKAANLSTIFICVVHDQNVRRVSEIYSFFRDLGAKGIIFTPRFLPNNKLDNIDPLVYQVFLREIAMFWHLDWIGGRNPPRIGVLQDLMAVAQGDLPVTCFFSWGCKNFLSVNGRGEFFATCTDALGIHLGAVDDPSLDKIVETYTSNGLSNLGERYGLHQMAIEGIGPGCPKYSRGHGDIYLPSLAELILWCKKMLTKSNR